MTDKDYLCWLMNQLQIAGGGPDGYLRLCEVLQGCPFMTIVRMDENRREEAMCLRDEYLDSSSKWCVEPFNRDYYTPIQWQYTCSMLELLVVIVRRLNYELLDSQYEADIWKWTEELLNNAGLSQFVNARFEADEHASEYVTKILKDIIYRQYGFDGEGSFFPLEHPRYDQRNVELLIQMNNYIEENYDIC